MQMLRTLLQNTAAGDVVATVALLVTLLLVRAAVLQRLRATDFPVESRRRWQVGLRNIVIALFVAGCTAIWAEQLRTLAVSLLAVAVAIVVATKELISCLTGAALRSSAGGIKLGDRIEIKGIRGDVIDFGALTTTVIEVGPGPAIHQATGRIVVIPNSLFLTESCANESLVRTYVFHTLVVPVALPVEVGALEQRLLAAAQEATAEFQDAAREVFSKVADQKNIGAPSVEPRVWVSIPDPEYVELSLRFVTPGDARGRIEQRILRRFLDGGLTPPAP